MTLNFFLFNLLLAYSLFLFFSFLRIRFTLFLLCLFVFGYLMLFTGFILPKALYTLLLGRIVIFFRFCVGFFLSCLSFGLFFLKSTRSKPL